MFVNTFSTNGKYSLLNSDNLKEPIKTIFSHRKKCVPEFFSAFSKSTLNFEHFKKQDDTDS